jgi:TrmH family RNA methyltransferase
LPNSAFFIQSRQNQQYKQWQKYVSHPERNEHPWIPVEGHKHITELSAEHPIELLLYSEASKTQAQPLRPRSRQFQRLSTPLLERLSSVRSSQQMVAFFEKPAWNWEDLTPWILYLDKLQDPGNLGTLMRTARATGMFSVVTSVESVACFNSKVVRASAAALFVVPFMERLKLEELRGRGYGLHAATPQDGESLFDVRLAPPQAIVIGNEGSGPTAATLALTDGRFQIPMQEHSQSLNAAVAGSLVVYEVFRRQGTHG